MAVKGRGLGLCSPVTRSTKGLAGDRGAFRLGSREGREDREGATSGRACPARLVRGRPVRHPRLMLDRYARKLRRQALVHMSSPGNSTLGLNWIQPVLVFGLCTWAAQASGLSLGTSVLLLAVPALLCLAWLAFAIWQWLTVYLRFRDRYYHLYEKKILSKEYREEPSPFAGHPKGPPSAK